MWVLGISLYVNLFLWAMFLEVFLELLSCKAGSDRVLQRFSGSFSGPGVDPRVSGVEPWGTLRIPSLGRLGFTKQGRKSGNHHLGMGQARSPLKGNTGPNKYPRDIFGVYLGKFSYNS